MNPLWYFGSRRLLLKNVSGSVSSLQLPAPMCAQDTTTAATRQAYPLQHLSFKTSLLATALFFLRNRRSQPCFVFLVVVSAWPCSAPPVTVSGSKATRSSKSSLSRDSLFHHRHLLHESPSSSISVVSLRHALVSVVLRSPRGRRD
ncbi:hypothetical protein F2Q70_00003293 [Brassica cretica]|uniref:Uncharacterized protein n=1 Tax=Brassica cretica TaxID=69181 RepID=A0A8S9ILI9_BRACR|nr:hypothetical protein F2Q70_00003293 [Brassica cretica]